MQQGSEFANATPFENKEIVEGITKLTSYGMTAKDVLPKVGDMASVMGKSLDQAVEAIADAQTGSMERLTFGLAAQEYAGNNAVNQVDNLKIEGV